PFGDGSGSTTVQDLRENQGTNNDYAASWSTPVRGSIFPSGCDGPLALPETHVVLTPDQTAAAEPVCRALGLSEADGELLRNCILDVHGGGYPAGLGAWATRERSAGRDVGLRVSIPPSIGDPDASTTTSPMMRTSAPGDERGQAVPVTLGGRPVPAPLLTVVGFH